MHPHDKAHQEIAAHSEPHKSAYSKPQLARHGTLVDLTRTSSGPSSDNFQTNCNHRPGISSNFCS